MLVQVAKYQCEGGDCPTIYRDTDDEDRVIVQGYDLPDAEAEQLRRSAGESFVLLPWSVILEAARKYRELED